MKIRASTKDVRQHILQTAKSIISGKGFSAVGLSEILQACEVPKGSFYHYFGSKEAFGEALLRCYFSEYQQSLDERLGAKTGTAAERLMAYFTSWLEVQSSPNCQDKCLTVKLAAEVSDLSESMRLVLEQGTERIIERLTQTLNDGLDEGSLVLNLDPKTLATTLYQLWLGASLRAKITRDAKPLESAKLATCGLLGLSLPS